MNVIRKIKEFVISKISPVSHVFDVVKQPIPSQSGKKYVLRQKLHTYSIQKTFIFHPIITYDDGKLILLEVDEELGDLEYVTIKSYFTYHDKDKTNINKEKMENRHRDIVIIFQFEKCIISFKCSVPELFSFKEQGSDASEQDIVWQIAFEIMKEFFKVKDDEDNKDNKGIESLVLVDPIRKAGKKKKQRKSKKNLRRKKRKSNKRKTK